MYVNVFFVIRCLYSAVSLTLVKEQRFIRIIIIIIIIIVVVVVVVVVVAIATIASYSRSLIQWLASHRLLWTV